MPKDVMCFLTGFGKNSRDHTQDFSLFGRLTTFNIYLQHKEAGFLLIITLLLQMLNQLIAEI
jgi:hypothetical protein